MEFTEITRKEYEKYWEKSDQKNFLSSPKIADLRKESGWINYFVGVKEDKKLIAAAILSSHKRHFGKYVFYSPRGPLLDYNNKELVDFYFTSVKKFIKEHRGYVYRIDPYIYYKERDINGDLVENGFDNTSIIDYLKELGFKKVSIPDTEQVIWMFSLPLEGKTEEDIQKEMKPNTRNTIRKAEKLGIEMKELEYSDLDEFMNIMKETGSRKGFDVRDIKYYQNMYNLFVKTGEAKFYITKLNLKNYINNLKEEIKDKETKRDELGSQSYNDGKRKSFNIEIENLNKRIKEAEEIIKEKNTDIINLSGSMFMLIQPEIVYLSSGNYEEFLRFNSQYLIQWELIKYGIKNGFKKHNFYGIPANINEHPKDYGIYEFKKGFNGVVEELIGEYELPITYHYKIIKLLRKIKK